MKIIYEKFTTKITLNGERLKTFPHIRSGEKKARCPLSTLLFNIILEGLVSVKVWEKKKTTKESSPVWEGRNKIVFICIYHEPACGKVLNIQGT